MNFFPELAGLPMEPAFMSALNLFRMRVGIPMVVHASYATEGHAPNSYHYQGRAIDFHFRGVDFCPMVPFMIKNWIGGLGIYPQWNQKGFHIDNRENPLCWFSHKKGVYCYEYR